MAKLDEIAAKFGADDGPEIDMETMPEESAGYRATPYPGEYGFQLPGEMDYDERIIDAKDAEGNLIMGPDNNVVKLKRLVTLFGDGHELKIIEASPENLDFVGESLRYRVSNSEYRYGKEKALVSEMGFLMRGLGETLPKGASNVEWAQAIAKHALDRFRATIEWDAHCDSEKKRYIHDAQQHKNIEDSMAGCGQRYGQRAYTKSDGTKVVQIPKQQEVQPDGSFAERFSESITCGCSAAVRCFPRLRKYRSFDQLEQQ